MNEFVELRINQEFAGLLFARNEGKLLGDSVKLIRIPIEDPRFKRIADVSKKVKSTHKQSFLFGWKIIREYTSEELKAAALMHLLIRRTFEPAGEECGTEYDESVACKICGANRKQISPLTLKKGSIPNNDIARTIAGEVVVSERFADVIREKSLQGMELSPVCFDDKESRHHQLKANREVKLTGNTIAGVNPFDFSESSPGSEFSIQGGHLREFEPEVYKCPKGHTIGLNLISEPFVENHEALQEDDFLASEQKVGVKRGLLRPEPLYLCSPRFRKLVIEEKLTGFGFEIAHVE